MHVNALSHRGARARVAVTALADHLPWSSTGDGCLHGARHGDGARRRTAGSPAARRGHCVMRSWNRSASPGSARMARRNCSCRASCFLQAGRQHVHRARHVALSGHGLFGSRTSVQQVERRDRPSVIGGLLGRAVMVKLGITPADRGSSAWCRNDSTIRFAHMVRSSAIYARAHRPAVVIGGEALGVGLGTASWHSSPGPRTRRIRRRSSRYH